ncbi:MAG: hypothetical protein AAB532_02280 [Patescibacteria group bacterium]
MNIDLDKLNYTFINKPLLIGGRAMEFYGLRKTGNDIDFVVIEEDLANLIKLYPDKIKDLSGDLGVCPFEFEIWKSISYFTYDELRRNSIEQENYLVISLEKLLFLKSLTLNLEKGLEDAVLIANKIIEEQSKKSEEINNHNKELLQS